MSRRKASLPPDYFKPAYAGNPDPWRFATSPYEHEKYSATLASLPKPHYASALEVGCSIGVFTRRLAERCDRLVAIDVVPAAIDAARRACADAPQVRLALCAVPAEWPEGHFDLIVIAEVAYFFDRKDLARLAKRVAGAIEPDGDVVLVHWVGETDFPLSGDEATDSLIALAGDLEQLHRSRTEHYRIDVLRARPGATVP